jgi:hypothetical protein
MSALPRQETGRLQSIGSRRKKMSAMMNLSQFQKCWTLVVFSSSYIRLQLIVVYKF